MPIISIYNDIHSDKIIYGAHLVERIWQNGIWLDQVLDTILTGIINKKEKDELSGRFTKFTISKNNIVVTVKDSKPAFIITANRR